MTIDNRITSALIASMISVFAFQSANATSLMPKGEPGSGVLSCMMQLRDPQNPTPANMSMIEFNSLVLHIYKQNNSAKITEVTVGGDGKYQEQYEVGSIQQLSGSRYQLEVSKKDYQQVAKYTYSLDHEGDVQILYQSNSPMIQPNSWIDMLHGGTYTANDPQYGPLTFISTGKCTFTPSSR